MDKLERCHREKKKAYPRSLFPRGYLQIGTDFYARFFLQVPCREIRTPRVRRFLLSCVQSDMTKSEVLFGKEESGSIQPTQRNRNFLYDLGG